MTYNEIEKKAKDWFGVQPMGSTVRNSGPAAMEGYMAGYKAAKAEELASLELASELRALFKAKSKNAV